MLCKTRTDVEADEFIPAWKRSVLNRSQSELFFRVYCRIDSGCISVFAPRSRFSSKYSASRSIRAPVSVSFFRPPRFSQFKRCSGWNNIWTSRFANPVWRSRRQVVARRCCESVGCVFERLARNTVFLLVFVWISGVLGGRRGCDRPGVGHVRSSSWFRKNSPGKKTVSVSNQCTYVLVDLVLVLCRPRCRQIQISNLHA